MIFPDITLETKLWDQGYVNVVGLDEVGRGPLAGPVVAGAVVINSKEQIVDTVRDSKKMTEKQRNIANELILRNSTAFGIGIVDNTMIDEIGISKAIQLAMRKAIDEILKKIDINYLIIDGNNVLRIGDYKTIQVVKGDMKHYSISAGSVIAKVARDSIMKEYAIKYPEYGFDSHVGYGTKKHIDAIYKYGVTEIHRRSFEPIKGMVS